MIPAIRSMEQFELAAVSSRDKEKAELFAEKFNCSAVHGYDQLLARDDVDAIYIPLPTKLTNEWAEKALSSGKHVLAEKSIADSLEKTKQLVSVSGMEKKVIMECFSFLYHSQLVLVHNYIRNGEIGELRLMRSSFGFPPFADKENIRYSKDLSGGSLLDAGAYTIRASQIFLGEDLEVLSASLTISKDYGVDIQGSAMLRNSHNIVSQIAFGFDNFYQNNIELWGTKGKLTMERAFTAQPGFSPLIILEKENERHQLSVRPDHQFKNILKVFYDAIKNNSYQQFHQELLHQSRILTKVRNYASDIR